MDGKLLFAALNDHCVSLTFGSQHLQKFLWQVKCQIDYLDSERGFSRTTPSFKCIALRQRIDSNFQINFIDLSESNGCWKWGLFLGVVSVYGTFCKAMQRPTAQPPIILHFEW